jgi:FkbM family methyltransferase
VLSRAVDIVFAARSPRLRAELLWALDPVYRPAKRLIDEFVTPGSVALDLGANWGQFTYRLSAAVGAGGRVLSFEPNPQVLDSLRAVAARCGNVELHEVALSDAGGTATLHVPLLQHRSGRIPDRAIHPMASVGVPSNRADRPHELREVPIRRLDDVVGPDDGPVTFVKCDVEGHELAALRGASDMLSRWHPPVFIEIEQRHQETPMTDVFDVLTGLGYEGYVLHGEVRPIAEFDVWRDQVQHLKPNALFTAAPPGYHYDFLFVAEGTPREVVARVTR